MMTPLVSVCMTTYNHERYIAEAIESVLAQRTSFDFEIVVGEDCSTDSTPTICRQYAERYPDKIRLITSAENVGWRANYRRTIAAARGRYIALCDGDDRWCDAEKLQAQFDLLEADSECAMCYTRSERRDFERGESQIYPPEQGHEDFASMLRLNTAENSTTMARRDLVEQYYAEVRPDQHPEWLTDDLPMWLWFAANHKIRFIDRVTATHRIVEGSVSHSRDYRKRIAFGDSLHEIMLWFDKRYNSSHARHDILRRAHRNALWAIASEGSVSEFVGRWWSDVCRSPRLLFCCDAAKIFIKRRLLRR
ncbi:MAG: glycosyltransferase [Alistipes sp.]|nr:glycosyltransferase [Alistipes sp.]